MAIFRSVFKTVFVVFIAMCSCVFALTFEESIMKAQKFNKTFKYYELEHKKNVINFISKLSGSNFSRESRDDALLPTLGFEKILWKGKSRSDKGADLDRFLVLEGSIGTRNIKKIIKELPDLLSNEAKCKSDKAKALLNCIKAYFGYYEVVAKSNVIEATYLFRKKILDYYRQRLALGDSYDIEVLERESEFIKAESDRKKNILEKKLKETEFCKQFGFMPNADLTLPTKNFFKYGSSLEELQQQALKENYELKSEYKKQSTYKALLISNSLPIDLTFDYKTVFVGDEKTKLQKKEDEKNSNKLSLRVNLSVGHVVDTCQISTTLKQNAIVIQQKIEAIQTNLLECWNKLEMSEEELNGCQKIYSTRQNILNMNQHKYEIGKESLIPIFEAQCKSYEARLLLLHAESEAWINYFELMNAVGKLDFKNLLSKEDINKETKVKSRKNTKLISSANKSLN